MSCWLWMFASYTLGLTSMFIAIGWGKAAARGDKQLEIEISAVKQERAPPTQ